MSHETVAVSPRSARECPRRKEDAMTDYEILMVVLTIIAIFFRVIGQNVLVVSPNKQGSQKTCEAHSKRLHHPIA